MTPARGVVTALTLGRFALAAAFPIAPAAGPSRLALVVASGLSDFLDGWLSRRYGLTSRFGQVADPIADKLFVAAVVGTLWAEGTLPAWQIPLVGFRDLAVAGGSAWLALTRGRASLTRLPPTLAGKAATAAQFVFLGWLLYDPLTARPAFAAAAVTSVAAGLDYLRRGGRAGATATPPPTRAS